MYMESMQKFTMVGCIVAFFNSNHSDITNTKLGRGSTNVNKMITYLTLNFVCSVIKLSERIKDLILNSNFKFQIE